MSDYKELRKAVKTRYASENFDKVNKCIENKLSGKSEYEQVNKIKSLICYIEGKLNETIFFPIAAICYSLAIGAITVICDMVGASDNQKIGVGLTMLAIAIILICIGALYARINKKDTFILRALNFKLDELNDKKENSKEASTPNEAVIGENIMSKKNEFEIFCDELVDSQANKIYYVRKQLKEKYKDNTDKYLMIKAEAQEDDYMQYLEKRISILALIFSAISVIISLTPKLGNELIDTVVKLIYLFLIIYALIKIGWKDKFISVRKWRKYILVVIDDLIEESKRSTATDQTDQTDITNEVSKANEQGEKEAIENM